MAYYVGNFQVYKYSPRAYRKGEKLYLSKTSLSQLEENPDSRSHDNFFYIKIVVFPK